jgi:hypothetical protein
VPDLRSVVIGLALAAALASCAGQCGTSSSSSGSQHLVFTGPAAGTLTNAKTLCIVYASQQQANYHLDGALGDQALALNIQIHSGYKGAGTYPAGSLLDGAGELRLQIGSYQGATASGAGAVTINSGQKSGSVDADLSGGEHVKGTFVCDHLATG